MIRPKNLKQLQAQSRHLLARRVDRHTLAVQSTSNPLANHVVTVEFRKDGTIWARCTCQWAMNRGVACSHVMAALEYMASIKNRTLSFWPSEQDARRQKQRVFYLSANGDDGDDGVWITSRTG